MSAGPRNPGSRIFALVLGWGLAAAAPPHLAAGASVAARAPSAVELATALIDALSGPGFPAGAAVAIHVANRAEPASPRAADLARALVPLLESLGASSVLVLQGAGSPGGAPTDSPSARARAAGAEHLLEVSWRTEDDGLIVEARTSTVDRGLWSTPPDVAPLLADVRLRFDGVASMQTPLPLPLPLPIGPEPVFEDLVLGPPAALLDWPGRIFALASCPAAPGAGERLLVLGQRHLAVFELDGARPRELGRLALGDRRPSPTPIRARFGTLRCGPSGRAAFAHGHLAEGAEVRFHPRVRWERGLDGVPVGWSPDGWWLARSVPGRPELGVDLRAPDGSAVRLEAEVRDVVVEATGEGFVVELDGALRPLQPSGAFGAKLQTVGVGLSGGRPDRPGAIAVTGSDPAAERLYLLWENRLLARPLASSAHATAVGRPRGARWGVWVAVEGDAGSSRLVWLALSGGGT